MWYYWSYFPWYQCFFFVSDHIYVEFTWATVFLLSYKQLLYLNLCKKSKGVGWGRGVLSRFLSEACSNKSPTPLWLFNLRIRGFENKKGKHVVWPSRIAQIKSPPHPWCFYWCSTIIAIIVESEHFWYKNNVHRPRVSWGKYDHDSCSLVDYESDFRSHRTSYDELSPRE